jgi:hypothetical protein
MANEFGGYYLRDGSPFIGVGTTTISSRLKADFSHMTTTVPQMCVRDVTSSQTLGPTTPRETDVPSLGYHYPVIDYVLNAATVNNCTLNIDQGTVLAFTWSPFYEWGLRLNPGARLNVNGYPTNRVIFARLAAVQENPSYTWQQPNVPMITFKGVFLPSGTMVTPLPEARFHYADFPALAGNAMHLGALSAGQEATYDCVGAVELDNCLFQSGTFCYESGGPQGRHMGLTNTVFERCFVELKDRQANHGNAAEQLTAANNLFYGSDLWVGPVASSSTWTFRDNLFDNSVIHGNGPLTINSHNAYVNMTGHHLPGTESAAQDLAALAYQIGSLGRFYLPTTAATLLWGGSIPAAGAGLYHFTSLANNTKQAFASFVNIGPAYIALDANGNPYDSNSDGVADFIADRNGDGDDADETPWLNPNQSQLAVLSVPLGAVSGVIRLPVNPGPYGSTLRYFSVVTDSQPLAAALGLPSTRSKSEIEIDTRCFPNGQLTFRAQATLADYNSGLQYLTVDSASVTITINNPVSYPDWNTWAGEDTAIFNLNVPLAADTCVVDVFDSGYPKSYAPSPVVHLQGAAAGGATSSSLALADSGLLGGAGHPDLFTVATPSASGTPTGPPTATATTVQDAGFPDVGGWYIAYEDSFFSVYDPSYNRARRPIGDPLQPFSTETWFQDGALEGWKGVMRWPIPYAAPNDYDPPVSGVSGTWPQTWPIRFCDYANNPSGRIPGDPFVAKDWNLFCRKIADPSCRNLYIGSHMTADTIGILHTDQLKGIQPLHHRFHFVFLDGCESGASPLMGEVFGFDNEEWHEGVPIDHYQGTGKKDENRPGGGVVFRQSFDWFIPTPFNPDQAGYIPEEFAQFYMDFQGNWTVASEDLINALHDACSAAQAKPTGLSTPPWREGCAAPIGYWNLRYNQFDTKSASW